MVSCSPKLNFSLAGSFGKKMPMDNLIAKQHYVNETLAFAVECGGFMYGTVSDEVKVEVNFIYEPPQIGMEERGCSGNRVAWGSGLKEWVTAVVKPEVNEVGGADVHFVAFQMSDMCITLFNEGEKDREVNFKVSCMKKDVVVGGKDVGVDNDFFLVAVKIFDHQGPLSCTFPIESRASLVTLKAIKNHMDRKESAPSVEPICDFHQLLALESAWT
ncbi:hypothetical protein Nepgr_032852 [Nepenthes gracilis]|uniref:Uncharacterized protein n=1 Tax=Nepenthes gracilis TaxID=150966 RepID=A0AAD3TKW0_NEPGR|nr:hypothetical protein Nepgr_032852 [Nepenthes gracilis]